MDKKNRRITLHWGILGTLLICQPCLANPIIISPSEALFHIIGAIGVCLTVDGIILVLGYALTKSLHLVGSLEFVKYLVFVVMAGFLINAIVVVFGKHFQITSTGGMILLSFLFLGACNLILSKSFFALPILKATLIGILMGLFTNPYLFSLALNNNSFY